MRLQSLRRQVAALRLAALKAESAQSVTAAANTTVGVCPYGHSWKGHLRFKVTIANQKVVIFKYLYGTSIFPGESNLCDCMYVQDVH